MSWLTAFITANLIGIGSNFDNCGIGIAYGSEKIKFPHRTNLLINIIGFVSALLGAYAGEVISHYISPENAAWAACIVLCVIGLFFWYSAYRPRISHNRNVMRVQEPGWKQGVLLGLSLSFTNIGSGFGATVSHATTMWATVVSITVWGYIMIWLGNTVGMGFLARILGRYSSLVSGLLLILVGIHQVL